MSEFPEDAELVMRAKAGDHRAFAILCERHRIRLWRTVAAVAKGPETEDLAQEAIVKAWHSLHSHRCDAPFAAWLCKIAVNSAHDFQKSAWRRRTLLFWRHPAEEAGSHGKPEPGADQVAEKRESQRRVRQAVAALPIRQSVPIHLYYFEEFTLAEVAALEQASESTIRSRIQAGLRRLAGTLEDLKPEDLDRAVISDPRSKGCEI